MTVIETISSKPSRRELLAGSLAGGFLLAFHVPARAANEPVQPPDATVGKFAPNAFIRIDNAGKTTLVMPQVEMGQGVYTAVAMILAEELDADYSQVTLEHAPPNDKLYGNPTFGLQVTGNSNSIRAFWKPLRNAGASARAMLLQAAAQQWQVEPASCTASNGQVVHADSGRKLSYGALADVAGSQTPPKDVPLKDPKNFTLIGKPLKRFDTPDKVNGKAVYGIDAMLPGMKFATLAACPVFGGKVGTVDDSAAKKSPAYRRLSCSTIWSRWSAITCGRRRRASMPSSWPGMKVQTPRSVRRIFGKIYVTRAKRTASSQSPKAISPRALQPATGLTRLTSFRFSRMRRWSR